MQETFGKYRLIDRLALGGMAEVFLATVQGEAGFSKPVVIKRLHPRLTEQYEFAQMLIDEARITAQLSHSNICQVLDLGSVGGAYFIALEYIEGRDLQALQDLYVRRGEFLPTEASIYILSEVLSGLDYAHRKCDTDGQPLCVIHRDISPQNVLISFEGDVKLIDFGIAKARQRLIKTQAGVIKGKFRYMSPEQASGDPVDRRTDIFAAGVVLYELLRGTPHSLDVPDTEVLRRMREAVFAPINRRRDEVPGSLVDLVFRALRRDARGRFDTAADFRQELLRILRELRPFGRTDLAELMQDAFPSQDQRGAALSPGPRNHDNDGGRARALAAADTTPLDEPWMESAQRHKRLSSATRDIAAESGEHTAPLEETSDHGPTLAQGRPRQTPGRSASRGSGASKNASEDSHYFDFSDDATLADDVADPGAGPKSPPAAAGPQAANRRGTPRPQAGAGASGAGGKVGQAIAALQKAKRSLLLGGVIALIAGGFLIGRHLSVSPGGAGDSGRRTVLGAGDSGVGARAGGQAMLRIASRPTGAAISLCGQAIAKVTPTTIPIPAKQSCELQLSLEGYEPHRTSVGPLSAGEAIEVRGTLRRVSQPIEPQVPLETGELVVDSTYVGTVYVDGAAMGLTPELKLKLPAGPHDVRIHFPTLDIDTQVKRVEVTPGQPVKLNLEP